MEALVSKILYLDKDYQPCGTRFVFRPDATHDTDRTDSDYIMQYGIRAFDKREFETLPRYWVPYEGDIEDFRDMRIRPDSLIESILVRHFRFISLHEVNNKIGRIMELLGFQSIYPDTDFTVPGGWIKENQTVVSLCGWDDDGKKFSLGNFLYSLQYGIDECQDAIKSIRKEIKEHNADMGFIREVGNTFRDSLKFRRIVFSPAYNAMEKTIHDLKKRMKEIERQRSYMHLVMRLIMTTTWYGK